MSDCAVAVRPCLTLAEPPVPQDDSTPDVGDLLAAAMQSPAVRRLGEMVPDFSTSGAGEAANLLSFVSRQPNLAGRIIAILDDQERGLGRETDALRRVLERPGPQAVRAAAVAVLLKDLAEEDDGAGPLDGFAVWRHMLWTGLCARALAERTRWADPDSAMLAGLMHDLGLLLENRHAPGPLAAALEGTGGFLTEQEQRHLGFDHTQAGERLVRACGMPDVLAAAVRNHHRSETCRGPWSGLVRCVEIADVLCTLGGVAATRLPATRIPTEALTGCPLARGQLRSLVAEARAEAFRYESVLSRAAGRARHAGSGSGPRLAAGLGGAGL